MPTYHAGDAGFSVNPFSQIARQSRLFVLPVRTPVQCVAMKLVSRAHIRVVPLTLAACLAITVVGCADSDTTDVAQTTSPQTSVTASSITTTTLSPTASDDSTTSSNKTLDPPSASSAASVTKRPDNTPAPGVPEDLSAPGAREEFISSLTSRGFKKPVATCVYDKFLETGVPPKAVVSGLTAEQENALKDSLKACVPVATPAATQ